jgi:flagellar motor switch protein FliN
MTEIPPTPGATPAPELLPELRPELRHWCEAWKTCFQNVVSQVSGTAAGASGAFQISQQPLPVADSDVWFTVVAGGAVRGEMTLRVPAAAGTYLARKLLGEPETPPPDATVEPATQNITAENKEGLEELLRQIAGLAATSLAAAAGGEVQLHVAASSAPSWSSDAVVCIQGSETEGAAPITIEIRISPALATALQPPPAEAAAPTATAGESAPASSYRRLMDVGLDVKLRFGSRRMLLRDVLALSAGAVVELENSLRSPVDLLLDGRLIAQGEVVIVDGKYGLRVTDVLDVPPLEV